MMRGYAAVWGVGRVRLSAGVGGYAPVQGGWKGTQVRRSATGGHLCRGVPRVTI